MKRIVGILITFIGIMFLIKPDFNVYETLETLLFMIYTYWPLFLICVGIYMQSTSLKKKK